jgi:FAD:protein FMN transferase
MGTEVVLLAPERRLAEAVAGVRRLFAEWEETLSRFRPESELSRLNAAAGEPFRAGPLLFAVVSRALEAAAATGGLFDPTLLRELERIGYDRTFSEVSRACAPDSRAPAPPAGWRGVRLDRRRRTIELPEGVGLELGGIAKGLCVDAAVERLGRLEATPALVSAGGDLRALRVPPVGYWAVAVGGGSAAEVVRLSAGAIATSGRIGRWWRQGTMERHHLIDPRTGDPAHSGLRLVSVAAGTCGHAEVGAKAAFVLGPGRGAAFLASIGLAGLFVADDGSVTAAGPWPGYRQAA